MGVTVTLKKAGAGDIPRITRLLKEYRLPASDVPDKIDSLFLALSDRHVVGIGGVELLGEYGLLRSLAVNRDDQGRGYGTAITDALIGHARERGVRELFLLTIDAQQFFKRQGFEEIDRSLAPVPIKETSQFSCL